MSELQLLPKYENDLADFATELRTRVFKSKLEAARHFGLARTTVSRYESGQLLPPLGYLTCLAQLVAGQLENEPLLFEGAKTRLWQEVNKVLRWHYREKEPFQKPFRDWNELSTLAFSYQNTHNQQQFNAFTERKIVSDTGNSNNRSNYSSIKRKEDWGEAIPPVFFFGRETELLTLEKWSITERYGLIFIFGWGGMGKTTLVNRVCELIQDDFTFLIWRSLRNVPPLDELLAEFIKFFSQQQVTELPQHPEGRISLLLDYLRKYRCLIVLDNFESVLQSNHRESAYQPGHSNYKGFLERIAGTSHQSCVIITSREKPAEWQLLEMEGKARALTLNGLPNEAGRKILEASNLKGSPEVFATLTSTYSGNPLALRLVAGTIHQLFHSEISTFLNEGQPIFGGVNHLLDEQFERLSPLEQNIMYWLAIGRDIVPLAALSQSLFPSILKKELWAALASLSNRSMVEENQEGFSLQSVIMEYVIERLIELTCQQLFNNQFEILRHYAFIWTQSKEYVQSIQQRILLDPLLSRLKQYFGSEEALEQHLVKSLQSLRQLSLPEQGYAGGNLANFLGRLKGDLRGYDFSHLKVWQARLDGRELQDVNFEGADLSGSTFTETFDVVCSVAFSTDGNYLAAGSSNGQIRVWRVFDGKVVFSGQSQHGTVHTIAFSPDSKVLASGGTDRNVRLWDVSTGGGDNNYRLRCLRVLEGHTNWIWTVAFDPKGGILASSSGDQSIRLWNLNTGNCIKVLTGHTNPVRAVTFNSDGTLLASGSGDQTIRIWKMPEGSLKSSLKGHEGWVQTVAFSPNGNRLASAGEDTTIKIWDIESTQCIKTLRGHLDWIWSIDFSSDGVKLASSSSDRNIRIWEQTNPDVWQGVATLQGHTAPVRSVKWQRTGNASTQMLASGSGDRTVKIWEVSAEVRCLRSWQGYSNSVRSISISPDGRVIAGCTTDRKVRLWRVADGVCIRTLASSGELFWSVAFSSDGKFLLGGTDERTLVMWDVKDGTQVLSWEGHSAWIQQVAFSPDSRMLASCSGDRSIKLWDLQDGRCLKTLTGHTDWIWGIAFSSDAKMLVSGSEDSTVRLWDIASGECSEVLISGSDWILSVAIHPAGKILAGASGNDRTIKLWDRASGQLTSTFPGLAGLVWSIVFSPDGTKLVSGSDDGLIKVWDPFTAECLATLEETNSGWIRCVVFNSDGTLLFSSSEDGSIRIWDTQCWPYRLHSIIKNEMPFERTNITGVTGISKAQKTTLLELGAVEKNS